MALPNRLKFGIYMAPFHQLGENPTLALERDMELIEWLDKLGFDDAWIGEHHSAGWETGYVDLDAETLVLRRKRREAGPKLTLDEVWPVHSAGSRPETLATDERTWTKGGFSPLVLSQP